MAKRMQRRWLSQLRTKDIRLRMLGFGLQSDKTLGVLSGHPDFLSYLESFSGPGPTPYQVQAIVFAETGSIVEKLNAFKQVDDWRAVDGGARRCLVEPSGFLSPFLGLLPAFLSAKRAFQFSVINGFKRLGVPWRISPRSTGIALGIYWWNI